MLDANYCSSNRLIACHVVPKSTLGCLQIIEHFEQMHAIQEEGADYDSSSYPQHAQHSQNPQLHLQQLASGQNSAQQPLQQGQNGQLPPLQQGQEGNQQAQDGGDSHQSALSVQTQMWHEQAGGSSPLLEAVLGHGLRHPNIVQTYKYATQAMRVRAWPLIVPVALLPSSSA